MNKSTMTLPAMDYAPPNLSEAELAPAQAQAREFAEIQAAVVLARSNRRNEDECWERVMRAAKRPTFAKDAEYIFPRGGSSVHGPSVYFAREACRVWGNLRWGIRIVSMTDTEVHLRAWSWDLESNNYTEADARFKKLVQRKDDKGVTRWVNPDERDLRELINRHGAIAERNVLLRQLPEDLVDSAVGLCETTRNQEAAKDPDAARKAVISAFSSINVTPSMLEAYLGHPLAQASPAEIARLRGVFKSIEDGNSTWQEYLRPTGAPPPPPPPGKAPTTADEKAQEFVKQRKAAAKKSAPPKKAEPQEATVAEQVNKIVEEVKAKASPPPPPPPAADTDPAGPHTGGSKPKQPPAEPSMIVNKNWPGDKAAKPDSKPKVVEEWLVPPEEVAPPQAKDKKTYAQLKAMPLEELKLFIRSEFSHFKHLGPQERFDLLAELSDFEGDAIVGLAELDYKSEADRLFLINLALKVQARKE